MHLKKLLYLIPILIISACADNSDKVKYPLVAQVVKTGLAEPFKFHKMLEVAPGKYYDIFSWGRGTDGGGQYMILRSDSADQQYNAQNGDLEGPIKDVLNADMDTDGNPEIIIYANAIDTNRFINVFVYEYNNDNAHKIDFPRLTDSQRKGYRGGDNFYTKDGKLIREFAIYNGIGKEATLSGAKRLIQYSLQSNSLYAKQLSKDSTSTTETTPKTVAKQHVTLKSSKKHVAASKKRLITGKRKKHRRR